MGTGSDGSIVPQKIVNNIIPGRELLQYMKVTIDWKRKIIER